MAPQVRLVVEPPARELDVRAPEGVGDRVGQRRLADARRTHEAEDGAGAARIAPPGGQVLDDSGLRGAEPGLPLVQNGADARQIDRPVVPPSPGEVLQPLDPGVHRTRAVRVRLGRQTGSFGGDRGPDGQRQRVDGDVPQELRHQGRRDDVRPGDTRGPAHKDQPADVREARPKIPDARLARVVADHPPNGVRLEADVTPGRRRAPRLALTAHRRRRARRQHLQLVEGGDEAVRKDDGGGRGRSGQRRPGRGRRIRRQEALGSRQRAFEGARQQMLLRDRHLLRVGVLREINDVKVGQDRFRKAAEPVGRHDPEDAGHVEPNASVTIPELAPARGVQHGADRRDVLLRVGTGTTNETIELIEDEHRVVHPGVHQTPHDGPAGVAHLAADDGRDIVAAEGCGDGRATQRPGDERGQRRLAGPRRADQAQDRLRPPDLARPHHQGGRRARRRTPARAGPLERQQVACLGDRAQEAEDGRVDSVKGGVPAVERVRHAVPVEALRRSLRPRQVEHQTETLELRPGGVGTGLEGLDRVLGQTLANGCWQPGPVDGADHLAARGAGDENIARRRERRGAGGGGRRAVDAAGQERGGRLVGAGGRVMEKTHGPPLVNDGHPGRRRQVRKPPELALPSRGDQVGRVPRLALGRGAAATALGRTGRPAEGGEGLTVLLDRGRVDQQHRRVITATQQLRAQVHVDFPSFTPNVQTTEITRCENTTARSESQNCLHRETVADGLQKHRSAATPDPAGGLPSGSNPPMEPERSRIDPRSFGLMAQSS